MSEITKIYLDLDGVFVDLQSKIDEIFGAGTQYGDIPAKEFWIEMEKVPHLFSNLDQIIGSTALFRYIETIPNKEIAILTSIPIPTGRLYTAKKDKEKWVRRNLSETIPVITVMGGKQKAKYANPNSLLIDDLKRNTELFSQSGGSIILHRSPAETIIKLSAMFPE